APVFAAILLEQLGQEIVAEIERETLADAADPVAIAAAGIDQPLDAEEGEEIGQGGADRRRRGQSRARAGARLGIAPAIVAPDLGEGLDMAPPPFLGRRRRLDLLHALAVDQALLEIDAA